MSFGIDRKNMIESASVRNEILRKKWIYVIDKAQTHEIENL